MGEPLDVRYFVTSDGARIAYAVLGRGAPLVMVPPWTSNLEALWEIAGHRRFCRRLAEQSTVVMYDRWGCGLSDRSRGDLDLDADVRVLDELIAHLRLRRVALYGPSQGGQVAVAHAALHPRTVTRLVLFGTSIGSSAGNPKWAALRQLMLADWPVAASAIAAVLLAGADREEQDTFARLLLACSSAEMAVGLLEANEHRDLTDVARRLPTPTLVASRRGDRFTPPEATRELAATLPNAQLALLDGDAHVHYLGDVDVFADTVLAYLHRDRRTTTPGDGPVSTLTVREREVLDLLGDGLTNTAVAERLVLSVRTVERHALNIYTKLGVRGRTEAVALMLQPTD